MPSLRCSRNRLPNLEDSHLAIGVVGVVDDSYPADDPDFAGAVALVTFLEVARLEGIAGERMCKPGDPVALRATKSTECLCRLEGETPSRARSFLVPRTAGNLRFEIFQAHPALGALVIPTPCHLPGMLGLALELELEKERSQLVLSRWLQAGDFAFQVLDRHYGVLFGRSPRWTSF